MEAHSLKRAETGGEDNNLSSVRAFPGRWEAWFIGIFAPWMSRLWEQQQPRAGGLADCSTGGQSSAVTRKCAEMRGRSLTEKLMMLFTFLSFAEDGNGTPTRGSSSFSRTQAHVLSGNVCGDHWTQMKIMMHMMNKTATHKSDL